MKDTVLLNVKSLIDAYTRQDSKAAMFTLCSNLLLFCSEKGLLLKSPFDEQGKLNLETIIKESSLTERGKLVFDDLADKWLMYAERTNKFNNVAMLEKWYNKMVNG